MLSEHFGDQRAMVLRYSLGDQDLDLDDKYELYRQRWNTEQAKYSKKRIGVVL